MDDRAWENHLQEITNTYAVKVYCTNCKKKLTTRIPCGTLIDDEALGTCGICNCEKLVRFKKKEKQRGNFK